MRTTIRVLLPLAIVFTLVLVSQGAVQNFHAARTVTTVTGQTQTIPGGPIASQEAIKEIGENGGGPYNANSSHPFENPNPITNILEIWMLLAIPFAFTWTFGKMVGDVKQGIAVLSAMFVLWFAISLVAMVFEANGNPQAHRRAARIRTSTATQSGGNMEGKEVRFGPAASGLFAVVDDRHVDRVGQLDARQLHADRRRGAAREHHARRGRPRRHRLGPLRHVAVRAARRCSSPA